MQHQKYESITLKNQEYLQKKDNLVVEAPLQININSEPYTVVMRTPNDDYNLVRGLLYAEDIYKNKEEFLFEIVETLHKIPTIINVTIRKKYLGSGYLNKRTLLSVSSCGICGKKELKDLEVNGVTIQQNLIFTLKNIEVMQKQMVSHQNTFKKTGGSHAAAIFNAKQEFLTLKEDIGRHNAVDKVVGHALKNKKLHLATYLFVSGRVSYEIVSKAFIAKIPVIIAVSACSTLAVDFAKEFGICLIGFKRDKKLTLYAQPQYLKTDYHD